MYLTCGKLKEELTCTTCGVVAQVILRVRYGVYGEDTRTAALRLPARARYVLFPRL